LTREPAETTAQSEAGDAGRRVDSHRRGQTVRLGRFIEIGESRAGLDVSPAFRRVHLNLSHIGEIDRQAAVGERVAGDVVPGAAHRDFEPVSPRKLDRRRHVGRRRAAHDQRRPPVDHRVPDLPRLFIAGVGRAQHAALNRAFQRLGRY